MTTPTRHNIPPEFLDAADEFVQLANRFNDKYPRDWVCAAMMYAAARYNAFVWVTREDNPEQPMDAAVAYYASEYDKMLRDNIDEIAPVYAQAQAQKQPSSPARCAPPTSSVSARACAITSRWRCPTAAS